MFLLSDHWSSPFWKPSGLSLVRFKGERVAKEGGAQGEKRENKRKQGRVDTR